MRRLVWQYYLFIFLRDLMFFVAVLVPFFTQWGGITLIQVQLLQSWFMLWFFLMEVPTGAVADLLGRKYSLALGAAVVAVAAFVYGQVAAWGVFLLGEFLFAVGMSLMSGADEAWLYDTLKQHGQEASAKRIMGRSQSMHLAAILVGSVMGSLIASRWGLNAPMLLTAIPLLAAMVVGLTLPEPRLHSGPKETVRYGTLVKSGLQYLWRHRPLWWLAVDSTLVSVAAYFVIWLNQPVLIQLGVPVVWFGGFTALLLIAELIISHNFELWERWLGRWSWSYMVVSAVLTSVGFLIVAIYPHVVTVVLFLVLAGGFGLTRVTFVSVQMNKYIESDKRATVLSSISMLRRLSYVIANPLVGFVADRSLRGALLLVAVIPLGAVWMWQKYRVVEK